MSYFIKGYNGSCCWEWYWGIYSKLESKIIVGEVVFVGKILYDVVYLFKLN